MRRFRNEICPKASFSEELQNLYALKLRAIFSVLRTEGFSFLSLCAYLIIEYVRPQSIVPSIDILPWGKLFLALCFVGLLFDGQRRWVKDKANLWMTLYLGVSCLSAANAAYPAVSWAHLIDFIDWYLIYFLIINVVTNRRRFFVFIALFVLASFKLSFFGARTWAARGFAFTSWGLAGPPGFFQNSGELSIQMLMFAPVVYEAALVLRPQLPKWKFLLLLLMPITAVMTIMGASSRGSQIALVYQSYRTLLKNRMSVKTLIVVTLIAAIGYSLIPAEQKARFSLVGDDRPSKQRLLYWKHGLEMIEAHPALGVGFYNFSQYYEDHFASDKLYDNAELPHNIFIQVGTDTGIVGLAFFLMILRRNFIASREVQAIGNDKGQRQTFDQAAARGLSIAAWGFVIAGQFVSVTYYPFIWINLALTIALRNINARSSAANENIVSFKVRSRLAS